MKGFKLLVGVFLSMFYLGVHAQGGSFESIANAMKNGDASALSSYFQSNVEISTVEVGNSYSSTQAEQVLKKFFNTHQPKSFTINHQGTSPQGSKYFVGNLQTSSGTFRTYVYAKQTATGLAIQEIRFEE